MNLAAAAAASAQRMSQPSTIDQHEISKPEQHLYVCMYVYGTYYAPIRRNQRKRFRGTEREAWLHTIG